MEETLLVSEKSERESCTVAGESSTWELVVEELKKVCYIALPMVVVSVSQNLLMVASMSMVGHIGKLELAGTAVATSLTNVTGFNLLFGMACALETLCGQAYGAGQFKKLGVYTYGGIIGLPLVCLPVALMWFFMDKLLILIGQDPLISVEARRFSVWLIPSLFPYAILQLLIHYLQSQSLILPLLWSSIATLLFHVPVCWALVFSLELGNIGAALSIGMSYTLNAILLGLYVNYSSVCEKTRICFSSDEIFQSVKEFFRFGVPSAVMICLEWWCFEVIVLLAGLMPNPQLQTSVLSICLTISTSHYFIPYAFGAATSTRVSNELGAGNPRGAKMAIWATMVLVLGEVFIVGATLFACRSVLGYAFSNEKEVLNYVKVMTPFLCASVMVDSFQAVLCGVARGCGWQNIAAYINLGAYYLVGIPVALVLGFILHLSGRGLWIGLIVGVSLQSSLLALVVCFTDWQNQATNARDRIFEGKNKEEKPTIS